MTTAELQRIAELSRLSFSNEELQQFATEFEAIVQYVGTINEADLDNVEPLVSVNDIPSPERIDVAGACLSTETALANAPSKNEAFFKVPKVLGS